MRWRSVPPPGWAHPYFGWHRVWHARRVWQARARVIVILLVVAVVAVLFGAPKWLMAASLIGALWPVPVRRERSLVEIEGRYGAAYTTALTAPDDAHGFARRLRGFAENIVRNGELPALPALEMVIALALVVLPFVVSFAPGTPGADAQAVTSTRPENPDTFPPALETPPVVLEGAQAPGTDSRGGVSAPGKAARGGSVPEGQVGQVKPGGGLSNEAPDEISREFLEALERGAIRSADGAGANRNGKVENRDRPGEQSNRQDGAGQETDAQGNQGNNANGQNGKNGQRGPNQQGQQNGNQQGQQNGNNADGQNQSGKPGQNAQNNPNASGNAQSQDPSQRFQRGLGPDESEQQGSGNSFDQGQQGRNGNNQPGSNRGGRGPSNSNKPGTAEDGQGKLEYLPGQPRGEDRRSGALQLPGDPRRPLTGTPGSPTYRRAAESAVLDPRLPPEYQEMLRNYYR